MNGIQPWNVCAARLRVDYNHIEASRLAHHFERTPDVSTANDDQLRREQKGLDEDAYLPAA
jgi:hypothetical protein